MSIRINIDDAYLFDIKYRDVYSVEYRMEMSDNNIKDDSKDIKLN